MCISLVVSNWLKIPFGVKSISKDDIIHTFHKVHIIIIGIIHHGLKNVWTISKKLKANISEINQWTNNLFHIRIKNANRIYSYIMQSVANIF